MMKLYLWTTYTKSIMYDCKEGYICIEIPPHKKKIGNYRSYMQRLEHDGVEEQRVKGVG